MNKKEFSKENASFPRVAVFPCRRVAFYGGSFDPIHCGHLTIARELIKQFKLDEFVFVPAFHAPHKRDKKPTSAFHRFAMLALATNDKPGIKVSKMELDVPHRPYTFETLTHLKNELTNTEIFFVMGADSWAEITTWREWKRVLTLTNIIVVTRPGYEIGFTHVTDEIRERVVDLRKERGTRDDSGNLVEGKERRGEEEKGRKGETTQRTTNNEQIIKDQRPKTKDQIYITDAIQIDISATEIRQKIREGNSNWRELVPKEVAKYIEKYQIYKICRKQ